MLICFSDIKGINHYILVPPKQSTKYSTFKFWHTYGTGWLHKWILYEDNYTTLLLKWFLARKKIQEVGHPVHPPHLAQCDFFMFPKLPELVSFLITWRPVWKDFKRIISRNPFRHGKDVVMCAESQKTIILKVTTLTKG
jgi:hypothetical protein